ncbi:MULTISPECIES: DUF6571 family protein [unclassified Streptomyces]|uniref:DUF6571 family protein n=1 Tax=unclassified Streptomyces TaxID=2593676 RepID=UPI0033A94A86
MDLDALRFGNLSKLGEAITDWEQMTKHLANLKEDAERNLKARADKANWAGDNATVTREFVDKTAGEFTDAHTQAESITKILKDTHGELVSYRTQLTDAIERGSKKNLTVMDTGNGTFTVTMNVHPDRAAKDTHVSEHAQQDVANFRDEIQRILTKATASDNSAAEVLKLLVDQAKHGFSGASYKDRDSAAETVKAAKNMADIMRKDPHELTSTELNQLNANLAKYGNDPLFAERLTTDIGAKKTLEFYAGVADPYQGYSRDPKMWDQAKQLQKNLGITIGTATLSDSEAMAGWKRKIIQLGPDRLGIDDANDPSGFAVMSNLMRFGDYDDQFLNDYGEKLIAFDKERNVKDMSPWINNWNQGDLNFWDKNDRGRDPMNGFLQALGHNPDAATRFFAQPEGTGGGVNKNSELHDHLKYLVKERIWLPDPTLDGERDFIAGHDALGHALEAATTGYAYDAAPMSGKDPMVPGSADHRTAATAGVMEQVAYLYGSEDGPKLLHRQSELADSLGKMGAAYIDDIDYSLSGLGDHAKDDGNFPAKYPGRADFGNQGAINFLSVLGQNETSHGVVTSAQHLYTLSMLDANPPTNDQNIDRARDALSAEAEARGILDNSRVQQAETTYGANAEEANKSLGRSTEWIKFGVGAVVGGGVACIPVPGAAGAGVAIAPIAAETAGEALSTFIGQQIDKGADSAEQDPREQAQVTSALFYDKGFETIGTSYETYFKAHPNAAEVADEQNWKEEIKAGYLGTGSHQNDYRGRPAYKED